MEFYSWELKIHTWVSSIHMQWKTKDSNSCWLCLKIFYTAFGPKVVFVFNMKKLYLLLP